MLLLQRREGETVHIGDNITVLVKSIQGKRVTLAIEAPRELLVLRGELREREATAREAQGESVCPNCEATGPDDAANRCRPIGDSCPGCEAPLAQAWNRQVADDAMTLEQMADELQAIIDGERPRLNKTEMREYVRDLRAAAQPAERGSADE